MALSLRDNSPANTKHVYNICTTLAQRLRRWSNIVQLLYKCFVLLVILMSLNPSCAFTVTSRLQQLKSLLRLISIGALFRPSALAAIVSGVVSNRRRLSDGIPFQSSKGSHHARHPRGNRTESIPG